MKLLRSLEDQISRQKKMKDIEKRGERSFLVENSVKY